MAEQLTVNIAGTTSKSYPIYIDNDDIKNLKFKLDKETENRKRLVIFSEKVYKIYGKELGFNRSEIFILKDGEQNKNFKNFEKIIKKLVSLKFSRKDIIIAIGGGVVGDISGFAASAYMRGIEFIQVPTTLLACVDSSVGGKTAIDVPDGKNYVGAFYQPKSVFINLQFLKTLDDSQYKSGLGEVIKYAFIENSCGCQEKFELLKLLQRERENILKKECLEKIITICLKLKSSVVEADEKEKGLRKILNLGHTFGHALEEETKYKRFTHGFAVVLGLMYVFNMALKKGLVSREYYDEAFKLINDFGYKIPRFYFINKKRLVNYMKTDKKSDKGNITFILPTDNCEVTEYIETESVNPKFEIGYISD